MGAACAFGARRLTRPDTARCAGGAQVGAGTGTGSAGKAASATASPAVRAEPSGQRRAGNECKRVSGRWCRHGRGRSEHGQPPEVGRPDADYQHQGAARRIRTAAGQPVEPADQAASAEAQAGTQAPMRVAVRPAPLRCRGRRCRGRRCWQSRRRGAAGPTRHRCPRDQGDQAASGPPVPPVPPVRVARPALRPPGQRAPAGGPGG